VPCDWLHDHALRQSTEEHLFIAQSQAETGKEYRTNVDGTGPQNGASEIVVFSSGCEGCGAGWFTEN